MTTHLAFLRAVNVGAHGAIAMADVRAWLEKLGFSDVRTLLQSGNVVFRNIRPVGAKLESLLESGAEKSLRLKTDFFVRTESEWKAVIAVNPFPSEAKRDPARLAVVILKTAPSGKQIEALQAAIKGREVARVHGRHAYVVYPDGMGRSRLTLAMIEKALGSRGTARNWNTVLKLAALAETSAPE